MKVIMYHYVRPIDNTLEGNLRHLTVEQFNRQLDYFQKKFGFLTPEEFKHNFENKIKSNKVILTFDDGLIDHYQYVFPILKERDLKGLFFIPTSIFKDNSILNVHKVHYLLSKFDSKIIHESSLEYLEFFEINRETNQENEIYKYSIHEPYEYKVKRLFNYELSYSNSRAVLNELFIKHRISKDISTEIYLNQKQLNEMSKSGQIIGSHTINHQILSSLSQKDQASEIEKSFNALSDYYSPEFKIISYPFGYKFTYNQITLSILEKQNVNYGFIFDNKESHEFKRHEISREDCNKFIF